MGRLLHFSPRGTPSGGPPLAGPEVPSEGRVSLLGDRSDAAWEALLEEERHRARVAWTVARLAVLAAVLVLVAWLLH